jgi:hypothetical protein
MGECTFKCKKLGQIYNETDKRCYNCSKDCFVCRDPERLSCLECDPRRIMIIYPESYTSENNRTVKCRINNTLYMDKMYSFTGFY